MFPRRPLAGTLARVLGLGLLSATLLLAACDGDDAGGDDPTPTETATVTATATADATASPTAEPTSTASPTGTPDATPTATATAAPDDSTSYQLFFTREPAPDDPTLVYAVERTAPASALPAAAVAALIEGPTEAERAEGYRSEWAQFEYTEAADDEPCGGERFAVEVTDATATVRFCDQPVLTGVLSDARAEAQLDATLSALPEIDRVVILGPDGGCLFDASGMDLCLDEAS